MLHVLNHAHFLRPKISLSVVPSVDKENDCFFVCDSWPQIYCRFGPNCHAGSLGTLQAFTAQNSSILISSVYRYASILFSIISLNETDCEKLILSSVDCAKKVFNLHKIVALSLAPRKCWALPSKQVLCEVVGKLIRNVCVYMIVD